MESYNYLNLYTYKFYIHKKNSTKYKKPSKKYT